MNNDEFGTTKFATVDWQVYEAIGVARQVGLDLSEEQARRFLVYYEARLKGVMTKAAFDLMWHLFSQWDIVEKKLSVSHVGDEKLPTSESDLPS